MMGAKTLEAQIVDGTAKALGDVGVLGKLAALMVEFDPRFKVLPGTKFRPEQIATSEPFQAVPTKSIAE